MKFFLEKQMARQTIAIPENSVLFIGCAEGRKKITPKSVQISNRKKVQVLAD